MNNRVVPQDGSKILIDPKKEAFKILRDQIIAGIIILLVLSLPIYLFIVKPILDNKKPTTMNKDPNYAYVIDWIEKNSDLGRSPTSEEYKKLSSVLVPMIRNQYKEIYSDGSLVDLRAPENLIMYGFRKLIKTKTHGEFKDEYKILSKYFKIK